jgi:hypothetical protein
MRKQFFLLTLSIFTITGFAQNFIWAHNMGGTGEAIANSVTVDATGNVYTCGALYGAVDFDPGTGTFIMISDSDSSIPDIFILKLDASGKFVWARRIGAANYDIAKSIVSDASGNIYVTGFFHGTVDFDPGLGTYYLSSAPGKNDLFILKLDSTGNFIWAKNTVMTNNGGGSCLTLDVHGNIYITGYFQGTADFDPGAGTYYLSTYTVGISDVFILKLDLSGDFVWAKNIGGPYQNCDANSITVDLSGNVYTTGSFTGTTDFDPGAGTYNLLSHGKKNIFISKLNASGDFVWAKAMGSNDIDLGKTIATDDSGNVYTQGYFVGTVDFDPGPSTYTLSTGILAFNDNFILKLDSSGNFIWAKQFGTDNFDELATFFVDRSGDVYITGSFIGTVDFDPGAGAYFMTDSGDYDLFILKLNSSGNFQWAKRIGGALYEEGSAITMDAPGNIYIAGSFGGTDDFDPGVGIYNLTSIGVYDMFVLKLRKTGLGMDDNPRAPGITIYPNPANEFITIQTGIDLVDLNFTIIDVTGRIVLRDNLKNKREVDISHLPQGLYFVRLGDASKVILKFVKQ